MQRKACGRRMVLAARSNDNLKRSHRLAFYIECVCCSNLTSKGELVEGYDLMSRLCKRCEGSHVALINAEDGQSSVSRATAAS